MHISTFLTNLLYHFLLREDGLTMSEVMWSLACVALIVGVAVLFGPQLGADWREFVGRPHR